MRKLDHRARRFLEQRLTALGRTPSGRKPLKWRGHMRWLPVGRARRYALLR